jgi:hypothetical protein
MLKGWLKSAALLAVVALALSACGGGDNKTGSTPTSPNIPSSTPLATCEGTAVAETGLPADFPVPDAVTFTKSSVAGPSQVLDGFATEGLEGMYNEWKEMFAETDYDVLFSEVEAPNDAEISYEGPTTTGQVALRNDCGGGDKIAVHVTSRPK